MSELQSSKHSEKKHNHNFLQLETGWDQFDNMLHNFSKRWPFQHLERASMAPEGMMLNPRVDIKEGKKSYDISAELPGLDTKDVSLEVKEGVLTLTGEKKTETSKDGEKDYHVMERSYGFFKRSFALPNGVDQEKISAEFKKGVLHVSIPKTEHAIKDQHKINIKG
ncbi:Hsp20/alpha crystallin family protein [Ningiella sp. W23]|uniref:Hsp20/alpha crystallin family protein n=1 Tax=Ningiella sp. W23 TaxID=3023715 RepID=UPI00375645EA